MPTIGVLLHFCAEFSVCGGGGGGGGGEGGRWESAVCNVWCSCSWYMTGSVTKMCWP